MKLKSIIVSVILATLLLSSCAPAAVNPTVDSSTSPTVQDIFNDTTTPSTSKSPTDSSASIPSTENSTEPSSGTVEVGGVNAAGFAVDSLKDENGSYINYEGGEMQLPLGLRASGRIAAEGVGMLLFIDGLPQPYKTDDEPEYAYLHTFYPEPDKDCVFNAYFIPVTGKQGDELEMYAVSIAYPTYSRADGFIPFVYTGGSIPVCLRLKYAQTPPSDTYPEKLPWLSETTVSFKDTTVADIPMWTEDDLRERIAYSFYVNETDDRHGRIEYDVSANEPLSLRYEVWGSPYVNFGLVIFVDNVPVADIDAEPFMLEVRSGQKTILETTLNLKQFDWESVIYAVLVPRNYRSSEVMTSAFMECSREIYLVEESS